MRYSYQAIVFSAFIQIAVSRPLFIIKFNQV